MSVKKQTDLNNETCAELLKALGDSVRLQIVRALQAGPMSVSDIATLLEIEIVNVSHHLRVLYHAGITTTERDGKYVYYRLNKEFIAPRSSSKTLDFGCCAIAMRDE